MYSFNFSGWCQVVSQNSYTHTHQQYLQDMNILIVPYSYKYLVFSIIFILAILEVAEFCYDFYLYSNEVSIVLKVTESWFNQVRYINKKWESWKKKFLYSQLLEMAGVAWHAT